VSEWLVAFSCGRMLRVHAGSEEQARRRAYVIERASAIVGIRRLSTNG